MTIQTPIIAAQTPVATADQYLGWRVAEITRIAEHWAGNAEAQREDPRFDVITEYSKPSLMLPNGVYETMIMTWGEFCTFATKIGYDGPTSQMTLCGPDSPMVGFKFRGLIDCHNSMAHRSTGKKAHDVKPLLKRPQDALGALRRISQSAAMQDGPVFIETISRSPLAEAGWDVCAAHYDGEGAKREHGYAFREQIMAGKRYNLNQRKFTKRSDCEKRNALILECTHPMKPREYNYFVCIRGIPGAHICFPFHEGHFFWFLDGTDGDVLQIMTTAREMASEDES